LVRLGRLHSLAASRLSGLGPLRERQFRLLFLGRFVSFLGNGIATIALAFAVLDLTGSKADLGFVLAARSLPQVVFLLVGGIWADRLPRHQVMVVSSIVSGASQGAIAMLLLTHHARIWHLIELAAVNGASSAFFFPASQGVIPQLVADDVRQQANALLRLALNVALIGGSAFGGFLVAAIGSGWAIAFDAATFGLAAVFIGALRLPPGQLEAASFLDDLREGWLEFRGRTWLWTIVLQFSVVNAAVTGAFNVLGPVVAQRDLGGAGPWGIVLAAQNLGFVAGGLLALRFRPRRMLFVATLAILAGGPSLIALGIPLPLLAIAAFALVSGVGIETFGVLWDTTMQQEIPPAKLSRVYSYDALGSFVLIPIGVAVVGPLAEVVGTRAALFCAAGLLYAATLPVLAVREVRTLERR
jgi:MFS family permease